MMLRYVFAKKFYPLFKLIANVYFSILNFIFTLVNLTRTKQGIGPVKDNLLLISAKEAAEKIRKREITSKQLILAYIARIKLVNPVINAVIHDNFDAAVAEAERVDSYLDGLGLDKGDNEYNELAESKPLLGVPFSCKDNILAKGFVTTAGHARYLKNAPNTKDAEVVARLKNSGAILIAITNMPKLAMDWAVENEVFGRTNNPYDTRRIPGGSSGGESALISSSASLFGLGNDLGGSVRIPSAMCGIFGLKPTAGLVSLDGFFPELDNEISRQQWAIGPLCRYADDLPIVLKAMVGDDILNKHGVKPFSSIDGQNLRVFYMEDLNISFVEFLHSEMRQAVRKTKKLFENKFGVFAQSVDFALAHHMYELWGSTGFSGLEALPNLSDVCAEIRKFMKKESEKTVPAIAFNTLGLFVGSRNEEERKLMDERRQRLRNQIVNLLGDDGLLIFPVFPHVATFHGQGHFKPVNIAYVQLFNILGLPAIACPVGMNSAGLPVGVQLVAAPYREGLLIAAAKVLESAFGGWQQPPQKM